MDNEVPTPTDLPEAPKAPEQITLPDDHPLVKTLSAQKEQIKELKASIGDLEPAAQKLQEIEDANKSEIERLTERVAAAESKNAKYEEEKARLAIVEDVARDTGVDAQLLGRMVGSTQEEIQANADLLPTSNAEPEPVPLAAGGERGDHITLPPDQILSIDKLQQMSPEQIEEARQQGRLNHLLGIN